MAYDPLLAERIRAALGAEADVAERAMFGGVAFLIRRHLTVVASHRGGLMVRADRDRALELVASTPAETVVMRDRPMPGWLHVDLEHIATDEALRGWIDEAVRHVATLPDKA